MGVSRSNTSLAVGGATAAWRLQNGGWRAGGGRWRAIAGICQGKPKRLWFAQAASGRRAGECQGAARVTRVQSDPSMTGGRQRGMPRGVVAHRLRAHVSSAAAADDFVGGWPSRTTCVRRRRRVGAQ